MLTVVAGPGAAAWPGAVAWPGAAAWPGAVLVAVRERDERRRRGREALVAGAGAAGRRERGRRRSSVQQPGADELEGGTDGEVDGRGEFGQPDGAISSRRPPGLSEFWG